MAEDFVSRPRTRPRTWDPRTRTRTQLFVIEAPRGRGQVLEDTSLFVCLSVVVGRIRAPYLLKPFDGFKCHLAGILVKSKDTLC